MAIHYVSSSLVDTYYAVNNAQRDIVALVDGTGTAVVNYSYDAWGNLESVTGSLASTVGTYNPIRYRGYVYDTETQLYFLNSRYYNPDFGRFLNADVYVSTGQGILGENMFAYCRNNPVNRIDVSGTYDQEIADGEADTPINDEGPSNTGGGSKSAPQRGIGGKGWHNDKTWKSNVKTIRNGGTIENLKGEVPTEAEGRNIINESGGYDIRKDPPHPEKSPYGYTNRHIYLHLHYTLPGNKSGVLRIKE